MELYTALEGPASATGSTFQLVLECLWQALLVITGSWGHSPCGPVFPWAMLLCTVGLVFLVKRRLTPRRGKALGTSCSAPHGVCGAPSEKRVATTQTDDAHRPPRGEVSPPRLQILCLLAFNRNLDTLLLWNTLNFVKMARKRRLQCPRVPGDKPILRSSEEAGDQLPSEAQKDVRENVHFPESPDLLHSEISRCRQRGQDKEREERLEQGEAGMEPVPRGPASRSAPSVDPGLQAVPSPHLPAKLGGAENRGVQPKREAGCGDHPVQRAAVDLKAGQPRAERPEIPELVRQIHSLQTREASLQAQNSQLESQIQQLKLILQKQEDEQDQHTRQLHRQLFQEEAQCLAIEKRLAGLYRDLNRTYQVCNLHKKIAQDLAQELERTMAHYHQEVLFHQDRAAKGWEAAASSERKFQQLRQENARKRQRLAVLERTCRPFPTGPPAPPAAPGGWQVCGGARGGQAPRKEEGRTGRAQGSRAPVGGTGLGAAGS
ncbi:uncharacterized protein LOC144301965 [Canis aureus]